MKNQVEHASRWIYQGIWAVLVRWFLVPDKPPTLPVARGETIESFQPAPEFLRYLKFKFWVLLVIIDGAILIPYLAASLALPLVGVILFLPVMAIVVLPDLLVYIALHLRYDTTWYVITSRSMRIRRGIWIIHETTITFENVQNIKIDQGPLQRYFGIASVVVETAGGGGSSKQQENPFLAGHHGLIEGVADAPRIRDLIVARLRQIQHAGLGDEPERELPRGAALADLTPALREVRDAAQALQTALSARLRDGAGATA
jgi:membrane protein YdbS with pleckstrin-like domain